MYNSEKRSSKNTLGFSELDQSQLECFHTDVSANHLRRRHSIKNQEHHNEPEYGVNHLHRELHCSEKQWKQAHVTGYGQRSEGSEIATILQRKQTERYDDEQYGLLMNVPAKEERSITAKRECRYESVPVRFEEELNESRLHSI